MHEGTDAMKLSKLHILTTCFENLKMKEDKSISNFNGRQCNIDNEAFALGEKFSEEKLVRKTLRYLPKRFTYKVTAIEEAKDVRRMKSKELMGSLRTFEMNLEEEKGDHKSKGIALQVEIHAEEMNSVCDDDNDLVESIVKIIKRLDRSNRNSSRSRDLGSVTTGVPSNTQKEHLY